MSYNDTLFPIPENPYKDEKPTGGTPRLCHPERYQITAIVGCLDQQIPINHRVRDVWAFAEQLDVSDILAKVRSVEGAAGRPAIEPKILLALWLFATIEGVGSARHLAELCIEHIAYRWICGDVKVSYHTLSSFRSENEAAFEKWLTESVAILMSHGIVTLEEVSQDGMRVRASAGNNSFRRKPTLKECLRAATEHVSKMKSEMESNLSASRTRQEAAKQRAAEERLDRVSGALKELKKLKEQRLERAERRSKPLSKEKVKEIRASTTDPEARKMKMGDGGFRPAYNVQFATDTHSRVIIGVDVCSGHDAYQMLPMVHQIEKRYGAIPSRWLVDQGYGNNTGVEEMNHLYPGCKVYTPPTAYYDNPACHIYPKDSPAVIEWKTRMATQDAQKVYKRRISTAEYVNAQTRNMGLYNFVVRGIRKVRSVSILYALTHNFVRGLSYLKTWQRAESLAY